MSRYTITLNDGKQLDGLLLNGTMFVSETEITADDLNAEALERVTITEIPDEGEISEITETVMQDAICDGILHWPEGWLFNLREASAEEKERKALQNRLDEAEAALIELAGMIGGMD